MEQIQSYKTRNGLTCFILNQDLTKKYGLRVCIYGKHKEFYLNLMHNGQLWHDKECDYDLIY